MLRDLLLVLNMIICLALIGVVLMQRSEGGAFGGGGNPTGLVTARGAGDLLTRTTWVLFILFLSLCLALTLMGGQDRSSGSFLASLKHTTINPQALQQAAPASPAPNTSGPNTAAPIQLPPMGGASQSGAGSAGAIALPPVVLRTRSPARPLPAGPKHAAIKPHALHQAPPPTSPAPDTVAPNTAAPIQLPPLGVPSDAPASPPSP